MALKPKDFKSKLSCKLKSIPRLTLSRAQARPALKLAGAGRGPITALLPQTKSCAGDPLAGALKAGARGGVDCLIGAFDLVSAQLAQRDSQDWAEGGSGPSRLPGAC